jgi:class 3 adenylate cyclase
MTDIVDSTKTAERLGDRLWRQTLADHNRVVRAQLERFRGHEVDTTGDGFLASFDSVIAALRCAKAICAGVAEVDVRVRVGVHTGEVHATATDVSGIAVHAVARVMATAGASQVAVSAVSRALATGSDLRFRAHGRHELKGFAEPVDLFLVE